MSRKRSSAWPYEKKTWRQTIDVLLRQGCSYGGVTALCKLFGVSKQAYYKSRKEPTDERKVSVEYPIVKYCEDVRQKGPNIGGKKPEDVTNFVSCLI